MSMLSPDRMAVLPRMGFLALVATALLGSGPAGAPQDPTAVGQWSAYATWPVNATHAHVLPTGKVMFWRSSSMRIWDPVTNVITTPPAPGYNIFCSGHSFAADGRLFVTGGHIQNGMGLNDASYYDPFSNQWTRLPDMNDGRWYPTNTTLASGEILTISGSRTAGGTNTTPQVWNPGSGTWRNLASLSTVLYPWMHAAPNGKVFMSGYSQTTRYLDTSGAGQWTTVGSRRFGSRSYGSSVMYYPGYVFVAGGGDPPTATAEVIDLWAGTPAWRYTNPMSIARRQINATILANGEILVTGGSSAAGFNTAAGAVLTGEIWNPWDESWRPTANYATFRGYHSVALLLPDGRVLSAGGDAATPTGTSREIYSPPYLFWGTRPVVNGVSSTAVGYGEWLFVDTPDAATISYVTWIRLGSVTHAINMDQRIDYPYWEPAGEGGLWVLPTGDPNWCPPGHYMLFLINSSGVPSLARIIRLG